MRISDLEMLPECPEELRPLILPFLQRAEELRGREPVVAYYCGMYAATLALTRGRSGTPEATAFTKALIESLEAEKRELPAEALAEAEAPRRAVLGLAMRIFLAADNEDRAGSADRKTARLFLISSQFMEVLRVFTNGEPGVPEVEERMRYARWRAAEIARAVSEGRRPEHPDGAADGAGESGADNVQTLPKSPALPSLSGQYQADGVSSTEARVFSSPSEGPMSTHSSGPKPANLGTISPKKPSSPPVNSPMRDTSQKSPLTAFPSPPTALPTVPNALPTALPTTLPSPPTAAQNIHDPAALGSAERHTRFVTTAIIFDDVPTAIRSLEEALRILRAL